MPSTTQDTPQVIEIPAGVFKDTCLAIMDEVHDQGKHYLITKHGRPVARLVPPITEAPTSYGMLRGMVVRQDDIISPDFEAWGEPEP